jgi:hypothetical protein
VPTRKQNLETDRGLLKPAKIIAVLTDVIQRGQSILLGKRAKSDYPSWSRLADAAATQCFGARSNTVFALSNVDGDSWLKEDYVGDLKSKLEILEADLTVAKLTADVDAKVEPEKAKSKSRPLLDVFLSHCKKDELLADALVELLRDCLELPRGKIRYTSGTGYRYAPGIDHDDEIRREVIECKVFIGLLTPNSIQSPYVLFELGARWAAEKQDAEKRIAPLMACGVNPDDLPGPVKGKNAFHASKKQELHEFVEKIATYLGKHQLAMSGSMSKIAKVVELAGASKSQSPVKHPTPDASDVPLLVKRWIRENEARLSKTRIVRFQEIADDLGVVVDYIAENFERSLVDSGFVLINKSAGVAELSRPPMSVELIPMRRSSRMNGL